VSFGITGNDKIGDYGYLDSYTATGSYMGQSGLVPVRLFNPDFGWETNKKGEIGLDLGLFGNGISINASYYHNISSNQLTGKPLPPTTGFTNILNNLPAKVQNTGIELEINAQILNNKAFTWDAGLNLTIPNTKLVEFRYLENSTYESFYQVGKPLNIRKVFLSNGVDPNTGVYEFEDLDGNGILDSE